MPCPAPETSSRTASLRLGRARAERRRRGDVAVAGRRRSLAPACRRFAFAAAWVLGSALPALAADAGPAPSAPAALAPFEVVADGIPNPLGGTAGDAARGRALIVARDAANCVLCHAVPDPGVRFSGNLGPSLDGVARRLSPPQMRLRVVESLRLNPHTIMPSYYRVDGLDRVGAAYRGKPVLDAGQVEDIVTYLGTLR